MTCSSPRPRKDGHTWFLSRPDLPWMARSSEAQGNVELHPPQSRQPPRITAVTPISFRQVSVCCKALFDAVIDGTDPPVKCAGDASDFGAAVSQNNNLPGLA